MSFDESNGSQVEYLDESVVGKEDPPRDTLKHLATGEIRPQEDKDTGKEDLQDDAAKSSADTLNVDVQATPTADHQGGSAAHKGGSAAYTWPFGTSTMGQPKHGPKKHGPSTA